jgi:hypothetical protein
MNGGQLTHSFSSGFSRLKEFGEELRSVILSILPSNTPIHLVLDGTSEEVTDDSATTFSGYRIGPTPIEVSERALGQ